jgi:hypothetical protein
MDDAKGPFIGFVGEHLDHVSSGNVIVALLSKRQKGYGLLITLRCI